MSGKRSLLVGGLAGTLLCAAFAAQAQETTANTAAPAPAIGNPQLKDFSLTPTERIVTQPPPEPQPATRPPATATTPTATPAAPPAARTIAERPPAATSTTPRTGPSAPPQSSSAPAEPSAVLDFGTDAPGASPAPAIPQPDLEPAPFAPEPPLEAPQGGTSWWPYALALALLGLVGVGLMRRRRREANAIAGSGFARTAAPALAEPQPVAAPVPRADPVPRPWLELSLTAERASFTDSEAEVLFELEIANTGGSAARNLRIDVKIFNAGAEQDKEIGAFFRTAGRETTKLSLPGVDSGVSGILKGRVKIAREEMRAVKLDERLLFIPVVAVNALYDWGNGRTGQTSRSYVIGRELEQPSDKMGAFRVDQGPRVWRTVGQRPHKLAKRV